MHKSKLFVIALCTVFTAVLAVYDGRVATIYACLCAGLYVSFEEIAHRSTR